MSTAITDSVNTTARSLGVGVKGGTRTMLKAGGMQPERSPDFIPKAPKNEMLTINTNDLKDTSSNEEKSTK